MRTWTSVFVLACCISIARAQDVWKDTSASPQKRAADLVSRLTLEEKIDLLGGTGFTTKEIKRLGIPAFIMTDGPVGVRNGKSIAYSAGIGLAASFDEENARRIGIALGREARGRGIHILLGPAMNLYRSPLCGRNFEYLGEDPLLAGKLAAAYVRGVQSQRVAATLKHFAGNEQEFDRNNIDTIADERTLRELYLKPFEIAVAEGWPACVMTSYNPLNGTHASQNGWLINDVLKREWGFGGLVMSDWTSCYDSLAMANAGLDLEMPTGKYFVTEKLLPLIHEGKVSQMVLDDKIQRLFFIAFSLGWFDQPQKDESIHVMEDPVNREIALRSARESIVLLKNDNALLPLNRPGIKHVVVMGPLATPAVVSGGGSAAITPIHPVSVLEGIKAAAGSAEIIHIPWTPPALTQDMLDRTPVGGIWKCEIFPNASLQGQPVVVRDDVKIDFNWKNKSPAKEAPEDNFSIRWTGTVHADKSDEWLVGIASDDGARIFFDGKKIIDHWEDHPLDEFDAVVHVEEGKDYPVIVEYYDRAKDARVHFGWGPRRDTVPAEAEPLIKNANAIVLCLGFNEATGAPTRAYEGEGRDRPFELPDEQLKMLAKVKAINSNIAVVLFAGGAVSTENWRDVPALLAAWYPGEEGGHALGETLFGQNNPSARLPFTWWVRWEDAPAFGHYPSAQTGRINSYEEGIFSGYRAKDRPTPLFAFGEGLSYTTFAITQNIATLHDTTIETQVTITNTGSRDGTAILQLYSTPPASPAPRPDRELKAFTRILLSAGEKKDITLRVPIKSLAYWDPTEKKWLVTPGEYRFTAGLSARDPGKSSIINILNDR